MMKKAILWAARDANGTVAIYADKPLLSLCGDYWLPCVLDAEDYVTLGGIEHLPEKDWRESCCAVEVTLTPLR